MGQLTQTTAEVQSNVDWHIPKTEGTGIKVDPAAPTFPWVDLIGFVQPNTSTPPTTQPSREVFRTGVNALEYDADDEMDIVFHVPHDWVPGSDSFVHLHWAHNGTAISGDFIASINVTYSSRDGATVFPAATTLVPISVSTPDVATIPQYMHYVTEIPLTTASPSAAEIDSDDIEVDGMFLVTVKTTTVPTITGGHLFIFTGDIHYQSTGIGTKNNAAPFYT